MQDYIFQVETVIDSSDYKFPYKKHFLVLPDDWPSEKVLPRFIKVQKDDQIFFICSACRNEIKEKFTDYRNKTKEERYLIDTWLKELITQWLIYKPLGFYSLYCSPEGRIQVYFGQGNDLWNCLYSVNDDLYRRAAAEYEDFVRDSFYFTDVVDKYCKELDVPAIEFNTYAASLC